MAALKLQFRQTVLQYRSLQYIIMLILAAVLLSFLKLVKDSRVFSTVPQGTPLTPNDPYRGRTAPLTSKRFILYIYSTNIGNEYFKKDIYSPFFLFKIQLVS